MGQAGQTKQWDTYDTKPTTLNLLSAYSKPTPILLSAYSLPTHCLLTTYSLPTPKLLTAYSLPTLHLLSAYSLPTPYLLSTHHPLPILHTPSLNPQFYASIVSIASITSIISTPATEAPKSLIVISIKICRNYFLILNLFCIFAKY